MRHYLVTPTNIATTPDCWVLANTPAEARSLIAANVPGAEAATDPAAFDCREDHGKLPPWGMIYRAGWGPLAVTARP